MWVVLVLLTVNVPYSNRDTVYMWVGLVPLNVSVPYSNRDTGLYVGRASVIDCKCALQ